MLSRNASLGVWTMVLLALGIASWAAVLVAIAWVLWCG